MSHSEITSLRSAWDIPWNDICLGKKLGEGAGGVVWAGKWRDSFPVAVKTIRADIMELEGLNESPHSVIADMRKEIEALQKIRHKNIVLVLCFCS